MTTTTISGARNSTEYLGGGTYGVDITPTGKITAGIGVAGPGNTTTATITNAGTINGSTFGVIIPFYADITNTGSIHGGDAGIFLTAGSLSNSGAISGTTIAVLISGLAENVSGTGFFTNQSTGHITSGDLGVGLKAYTGQTIIFENAGSVSGTISGVYVADSTFGNTGVVSSSTYAVYLQGGTVTNGGTIIGGEAGISLNLGTVTNQSAPVGATIFNQGYIFGNSVGITYNNTTNYFPGNGNIYNSGTIKGNVTGIKLAQGTITNSALIEGTGTGISLNSGTVFNDGTISGGTTAIDAIYQLNLYVNGGSFKGKVTDHAGSGALILQGTNNALDIGTSFTGFSSISFAGTDLSLESGSIGVAAGQTITGFSYGDTIILDNFVVNTLDTTYVSGIGLELTDTLGHQVTLDITGNNLSTSSFVVFDPTGNTTIEEVPPICYLRGTRIATPAGDVAIESLRIGDSVITKFNGYRQIKWIGRQNYAPRFIANNFEQIPVCITAGALGAGTPRRDLFVSPGHSMLLDGQLVLAKNLVNGVTILQTLPTEDVHYYQLEFETHDCILAEGAWSESYADTPDLRAKFHNAREFHALYPDHIAPAVQILCAPRPLEGPELEALLRPFAANAAAGARPGRLHGFIDSINGANIQGWAWDETNPHLPVLLEILVAGHRIGTALACQPRADLAAAGYAQGNCGFSFTSPLGLPAELAQITIRRAADGAALHLITQTRKIA